MAIYASSDWHGNGKIWELVKDFLKKDDILYFLGDAVDRGPDGWRMLKEMLADERIIFIPGNHELMLMDRIKYPFDYEIANLHNINGGWPTWIAANNDPEAPEIRETLKKCKLWDKYTTTDGMRIFMSHSGSDDIYDQEDLVWNRTHYYSNKPSEDMYYDIIVHGHTTIPHLIEDLKEANEFYGSKYQIPEWDGGAYIYNSCKVDIDCQTVVTNRTVLLELDTFDEHVFEA